METYIEILERMQDKFNELSGYSADEASDIGIRLKVLAGEIFSLKASFEWLKKQMFAQTAQGDQLDFHAQQRGLLRKTDIKSKGILTFSRETVLDYDIEIPEGTVCATSDVNGVRFETIQAVTLTAGTLSIEANAESIEGGSNKNTGKDTITVMVSPPAGISSVNNSAAFTGGLDGETDEELRARIIDSYKNISNGTNISFYKNEVLKHDGVYSASVVPLARGAGTVDIYIAGKGTLPSSALISSVQNDIEELREINVDVEIKEPTLVPVNMTVNIKEKPGYIFNDVKNECLEIIDDYYESLSIGENAVFAAIGSAIFQIEGIENYRFDSTVSYDQTIDVDELAVPGTISVLPMIS